ncbi:MAG: ATP-binding protein [Holophaga sp.]|nr:ATP-binding protein [Holophaga sp.]
MPERASISIRDRFGFERSVPAQRSMVLGRQAQCDIVLPDGMISRTHLRIELNEDGWWVEDLGSSHGTFHQDQRVERMRWEPGSTIQLADGAYFLTLQAERPASSSEVNLQAILQTAALLTGQVELDDLLEQTIDRLLGLSGTDRGFIMLPEQGELVVKVQRNLGAGPAHLAEDIQLSMSSVQQVFDQGEPVWIHNAASNEQMQARQSVADLRIQTILCLPMLVQGQRIGVLYLDSRNTVTEPVDRATFEAIVSLCAIAIERTRLAEAELRNQLLATVGQVAGTIIHDFKNGLFVIAGHAQLLGLTGTDANTQHHLAQILGATERLGQLSMDILEYAKIREPRRELVDLAPFLAAQVEPLQPRAQDSEVALVCQGPPCQAFLDGQRFNRVIENLLGNALDALTGSQDGRVTLDWGPAEDGGVWIRVADNGKGIPRKLQKRIFEPFFSYGKARGTGLGMATVQRIMAEHQGTLDLVSEEGQGTTITLRLPPSPGDRSATGGFATHQEGPQ